VGASTALLAKAACIAARLRTCRTSAMSWTPIERCCAETLPHKLGLSLWAKRVSSPQSVTYQCVHDNA
jgi:hypothetical protein